MKIVMNVYFVTLLQFSISSHSNRTFDDVNGILDTFIKPTEGVDQIDVDKTRQRNNSNIFYIRGPEVSYISEDNPNRRISDAKAEEGSAQNFASGLPVEYRNQRKYLTDHSVKALQNESDETDSNESLSEEFIVEYNDPPPIPTSFDENMNDKVFEKPVLRSSDQGSDDFKSAYPTEGPDMLDTFGQDIQEAPIGLPYYPSVVADPEISEQNQGATDDIANGMLVDLSLNEDHESPVYRYIPAPENTVLENKAKYILKDLVKNIVTEEVSAYLKNTPNIPYMENTPLNALDMIPAVPLVSYLASTQPIRTIIHHEYPSQQISRCCTTYTKK